MYTGSAVGYGFSIRLQNPSSASGSFYSEAELRAYFSARYQQSRNPIRRWIGARFQLQIVPLVSA